MKYLEHTIGTRALVRDKANQILLILSPARGWEMPGGLLHEGETIKYGLKREILEETGIVSEIGEMVALYSEITSSKLCKIAATFQATKTGGKLTTSEESIDIGWFDVSEALIRVTNLMQKQRLEDALAYSSTSSPIYRVFTEFPYQVLQTTLF